VEDEALAEDELPEIGPEIETEIEAVAQAVATPTMGLMRGVMTVMEPLGRQEVRPKMKTPVHLEPKLWTQIYSCCPLGKK
jgi:hypothetical protein